MQNYATIRREFRSYLKVWTFFFIWVFIYFCSRNQGWCLKVHWQHCCPRDNAYLPHPGAEASEPQKTFVGRPLDVCEVREPAANLSIEVRIGSGSRAGASLFAAGLIRSWTVSLMCLMSTHWHCNLRPLDATPVLSRFNYDAMPSLKSLDLSIAVL